MFFFYCKINVLSEAGFQMKIDDSEELSHQIDGKTAVLLKVEDEDRLHRRFNILCL
jgi:hypothetical protein